MIHVSISSVLTRPNPFATQPKPAHRQRIEPYPMSRVPTTQLDQTMSNTIQNSKINGYNEMKRTDKTSKHNNRMSKIMGHNII